MSVFSKHDLVNAVGLCSCQQLFHPWTPTCSLFILDIMICSLRGTYKFFAVMNVVQLLMKGRDLSKTYLKKQLLEYVRSTFFGALLSTATAASCCYLRWLLGRFYLHSIIFIPTLFGAAATIFLEKPEKRSLYSFTFFQMCIEYFLRALDSSIRGGLTRRSETLVFMLWNSLLLLLLTGDSGKTKTYWFFRPTRFDKKKGSRCYHQGSCWKYVLLNTSKYMSIGIGLELLHTILTNTRLLVSRPLSLVMRRKTLGLGAFLGTYVGLYSCVMCLTCRRADLHPGLRVWGAGFLAGASYWFYPNRTIAASTITNALQLAVSRRLAPSLPLASEGLFVLCSGILFHVYMTDYARCPGFINKALSTGTGGRTDYVIQNIKQLVANYLSMK